MGNASHYTLSSVVRPLRSCMGPVKFRKKNIIVLFQIHGKFLWVSIINLECIKAMLRISHHNLVFHFRENKINRWHMEMMLTILGK